MQIINGKIRYALFLTKRKSLQIAVYPNQDIVVRAPYSLSIETIEEKIQKRAGWIKRNITYFVQFRLAERIKEYRYGESHLYLGRRYTLKIREAACDRVFLKNGFIQVDSTDLRPRHIQNLLALWYKERALVHFSRIFEACWENFKQEGDNKPILHLKNLKRRWGSFSSKGNLTLNTILIQATKPCIEYVIMHEFCHLIHYNHGPNFYKILNRIMPDWLIRKKNSKSCQLLI